jgi:hypothetical protein
VKEELKDAVLSKEMRLEILNLSGNVEVDFPTMKLISEFLIEKTDALLSLQKLYLRRFLKTQTGLDEVLKDIKKMLEERNKDFSPVDETATKTQASGSIIDGGVDKNGKEPRNEKNLNKITPDAILKDDENNKFAVTDNNLPAVIINEKDLAEIQQKEKEKKLKIYKFQKLKNDFFDKFSDKTFAIFLKQ